MTSQSVIVTLLFMMFTWSSVTVQSFHFPPYDYKMTYDDYMFDPQPRYELPYSFHGHGLLDTMKDVYKEYKPYAPIICKYIPFNTHFPSKKTLNLYFVYYWKLVSGLNKVTVEKLEQELHTFVEYLSSSYYFVVVDSLFLCITVCRPLFVYTLGIFKVFLQMSFIKYTMVLLIDKHTKDIFEKYYYKFSIFFSAIAWRVLSAAEIFG